MPRTSAKLLLLGLSILFLIPDTSEGQLFRRRRRNTVVYSDYSVEPAAAQVTKPVAGLIRQRSEIDRNEYDYNWAARRNWHQKDESPMLFADKVRVKVLLKDAHSQIHGDLRVRAHWFYLHKTQSHHSTWSGLTPKKESVYFDVDGIEEGRVVKVVSDFYAKTDQQPPNEQALKNASYVQNDEGTFKFVGRMHVPYYGVTSSEANEELRRRARIVSFGFSQWYADEAYGGRLCDYDCYSFYQTSAGGELEGFDLQPVDHASVPEMAKNGKRFHGDYLIMPGHFGMALCYDEDTGNFCTLEGNYALNGPYRINIDPDYHGLYSWSSILTISQSAPPEPPVMN